jgi:hypothetical protein
MLIISSKAIDLWTKKCDSLIDHRLHEQDWKHLAEMELLLRVSHDPSDTHTTFPLTDVPSRSRK